jgi:hypothetical protein
VGLRCRYFVAGLIGVAASALAPLVKEGVVPIPEGFMWASPVVVAVLLYIASQMPKANGETGGDETKE